MKSFLHPVLVGTLLLCNGVCADDWSAPQHDSAHTNRSSATFDARQLTLSWRTPSEYSSPIIAADTMYAIKTGGAISAFSLHDGTIKWTQQVDSMGIGKLSFLDGRLVTLGWMSDLHPTLFVLNAETGKLQYDFHLTNHYNDSIPPTLFGDPITHTITAYIRSTSTDLTAIVLGQSAAEVLWDRNQQNGLLGPSAATVVGDSIVVAGSGHYFAYNRFTGDEYEFHLGNLSGGGQTYVAYDADRQQIYISAEYNIDDQGHIRTFLSAYHYNSPTDISLLWQSAGGGAIAIGPSGNLYMGPFEIDPDNGRVLRTLLLPDRTTLSPHSLAVTTHDLFGYSYRGAAAIDLQSGLLSWLGSMNAPPFNPYVGPIVVVSDQHVAVESLDAGGRFLTVYSAPVPEPSILCQCAVGLVIMSRFRFATPAPHQIPPHFTPVPATENFSTILLLLGHDLC